MNDITGWAKALLEFRNLIFVVVDTTSVKRDSDLLRFFTLDQHGYAEDDMLIIPGRYPGVLNTEWTGITKEQMNYAEDLPMIWSDITRALTGKFVLAYGLDFLQDRLDENAKHYGLHHIHLIGDCLMATAPAYFRVNAPAMKLVDACARVGHILPDRPDAEQRARGQLALLRAMAEGRTSPPAPAPVDEDEGLSDLDAHPY